MLLYHAIEEIEHKAVAFDVFMSCVGDRKMLRRVQKNAIATFTRLTTKYMIIMLWRARIFPSWRDIKSFSKFMFLKGGMMPNLSGPFKEFFREDFHPWDHQNQGLVDQWKNEHYNPTHEQSSEQLEQAKAG